MSDKNIESAWRATGFIPFNLATVYRKLEAKGNYIPSLHNPSVTTPRNHTGISILQSPANLDQVNQIDKLISQFRNQTLDTPKVVLLFKLVRGARLAMADCTILTKTNTKLYKANIRKKRRAHCTETQYNGEGARYLGLEEVEQRRQYAINKQQELEAKQTARKTRQEEAELAKACKELMRFGLNLIDPTHVTPIPKPKSVQVRKKQTSTISTQSKLRKTVTKRHVRFVGIEVQKEVEEETTTRVSSRGRIIRNKRI